MSFELDNDSIPITAWTSSAYHHLDKIASVNGITTI